MDTSSSRQSRRLLPPTSGYRRGTRNTSHLSLSSKMSTAANSVATTTTPSERQLKLPANSASLSPPPLTEQNLQLLLRSPSASLHSIAAVTQNSSALLPVPAPPPSSRMTTHLTVEHPQHRALKTAASSASLRSRENSLAPTSPSPALSVNDPNNSAGNVRVVVRVRAHLPREIEKGLPNLIEMNPDTQETHLNPPPEVNQKSRKVFERKTFTFDNSFWSCDRDDEYYADQDDVYNALGIEFLDHNFEGYHTCIFAYGQTGSGKSYSMMGTPEHPGLIPRTCRDLFERIESNNSPDVTYTVRVSYFEVYNEHVRDLLVPRRDTPYYLKVRESPTEGPYVKDLTEVPVRGISEVLKWMKMGDNSRTVASTKMNDTSSRSHAVFTLVLKQIHHDMDTDETTERLARIRLVDLAGSERANSTGATGARLREGSNINKSLTTLGRVIAALAEDPSKSRGPRKKEIVPYRDSVLTWLLKDSLGGNSKTAMIACISPTDYDETLSTLRYADQAKRIRTKATINQDHISSAERDAQIKEMQETIRNLQLSVSQAQTQKKQSEATNEQLEMYQQQVERMQRAMEDAKLVAESKIKSLQTQNEALKRHLRLCLETMKNPIPVPPTYAESDEEDSESEYEEERNEIEDQIASLWGDLQSFKKNLAVDKERFGITTTIRVEEVIPSDEDEGEGEVQDYEGEDEELVHEEHEPEPEMVAVEA